MRYNVFAYNCYEDFLIEEPLLVASFDNFEDAEDFIKSNGFYQKTKVFDVNNEIKWYFPSCNEKGELVSPSTDDDIVECSLMVYIEPEEHNSNWEPDPIEKRYILDYQGNVNWE